MASLRLVSAQAAWRPFFGASRLRALASERGALPKYDPSKCFLRDPEESRLLVRYPLSSMEVVLNEYIRHDGGLRIGKLLEDMDAASGDVAQRHIFIPGHRAPDTVTACVDQIRINQIPSLKGHNTDLLLDGKLIWTGRSSLLIRVQMWLISGSFQPDLSSYSTLETGDSAAALSSTPGPRYSAETARSLKRIYRIAKFNKVADRIGQENAGPEFAQLGQRLIPDERELLIRADFVFVAVDPETRKSVPVNGIKLQTPEAKELFSLGEQSKNVRRSQSDRSLEKTIPTEEEINYMHAYYVNGWLSKGVPSSTDIFDIAATGAIRESLPVSSTKLRSVHKTQPQEQNGYGNIFGGLLMRLALELAYQNIALFSACTSPRWQLQDCDLALVDDIVFARPVHIGSELCFTSHVTYTDGEWAHVFVTAEIYNYETRTKFLSNNFSYIFRHKRDPWAAVVPLTYPDMMLQLLGRRALQSYTAACAGSG